MFSLASQLTTTEKSIYSKTDNQAYQEEIEKKIPH